MLPLDLNPGPEVRVKKLFAKLENYYKQNTVQYLFMVNLSILLCGYSNFTVYGNVYKVQFGAIEQ